MAPRHAVLVAGAVALLGATVYLFRAVRVDPVSASGRSAERGEGAAAPRDPGEAREAGERSGAIRPAIAGGGARGRGGEGEGDGGGGGGSDAAEAGGHGAPRSRVVGQFRSRPNAVEQEKLEAVMREANAAYDRGDFDEARSIAYKILSASPTNVRMLRVVVSSACIMGDADEAARSFQKLPAFDRNQMRVRCARHGVSFPGT